MPCRLRAESEGAVLELTHNWDTTSYDLGNGFGRGARRRRCPAACALIKARATKSARAGPMKHGTTVIAFAEDPDGYKIELIQFGTLDHHRCPFPSFFTEIPPIVVHDRLAEFLGAADGGVIEYRYADAVKLAGHSCPTVAGAFLLARRALASLYTGADSRSAVVFGSISGTRRRPLSPASWRL